MGEAMRYLYRRIGVPLSLDTETTGLDWLRCKVFLFAICDGVRTFVYPVTPRLHGMYLEILNEVFNVQKHPIICHNIKFDMHVLHTTFGFECLNTEWHDTLLMAHLLDENRRNGLKNLMVDVLKMEDTEYQEVSAYFKEQKTRSKDRDYSKLPDLLAYKYVEKDALSTRKLFDKLLPSIDYHFKSLYERESKVLKVLYKMEKNGLPVDEEYLHRYQEKLSHLVKNQKDELQDEARININSSQQLGKYLSQSLHIPITSVTPKTKKPKVDADMLKRIDHPFVTRLLSYRENSTVQSRYIDSYIEKVYKGKVHGAYSLTGTVTGRLSSHNPNVQNIPKRESVKRIFITEPGQEMYLWDESQIEMRGMAFYSQDPSLIRAVKSTDIYAAAGKEVIKREVTPYERQCFKAICLSLGFMAGDGALIDYARASGLKASNQDLITFRKAFLDKFYVLREWQMQVMDTVKQNRVPWGHYVRNQYGRVRRLRNLYGYNKKSLYCTMCP